MKLLVIAVALVWVFGPCRVVAQQASTPLAERADHSWVHLHQSDDITWAYRTRMPVADFQKLRRAAGITDEQPLVRIEMVDSRTLPHERVLFVSVSGNRHCLIVGVYQHRGRDFRELWSTREMPDGGDFCSESPCPNSRVFATQKGEVTIGVFPHDKDAGAEECDHVRVLTYRPVGKTYQLVNQKTAPAYCGLDNYQQTLDMVLGRAVDGERVATVQILPSFQPETAIAFDRTPNGLVVSRITFRKQLWAQLGLGAGGPAKTPSQCIELAKAAALERTPVPIPRELAQRFIDDLAKMDFATDRCPRHKDGTCAGVLDGLAYVIQFKDSRSARLTEVSAFSGMKSENPALSNWVTELLKEIGPPAAK
jgi:hypothetical protein